MADAFNAYHKWLGIPPKDQPPNLYRLLGVEQFEADEDVISAAADQRMVFLRSFQSGKNADAAEALLNEISNARVCLLTPERRQAYDRQLRAKSSTLPAPRPMTPGAVAQEQSLAQLRTLSGAAALPLAKDSQEVALAPVSLPGKAAAPPPRKSGPLPGPLPMAAYAPPAPEKLERPPPKPNLPPPAPVGPSLVESSGIALSALFATLPQRAWGAMVFLFRLPGVIAWWLLRAADGALLALVGEENLILHNFLRIVVPAVLAIVILVGGIFGSRWAVPRIATALRERAAARAEAERQRQLAPAPLTQEFVMVDSPAGSLLVDTPPPFIPPVESSNNTVTTPDNSAATDPPVDATVTTGLQNAPQYTANQLQSQITLARQVESYLDALIDPRSNAEARRNLLFEYRQTTRDLAHTATFTRDIPFNASNDIADIIARAHNSRLKRQFYITRAASELKRPGPDLPGLIVCGTIKDKQFQQGLFETTIEIDGRRPQQVLVVSTENLAEAHPLESEVVVIGAIVDKPANLIGGFTGANDPVVWGGQFISAPTLTDAVASAADDSPIDVEADLPVEEEEPIEIGPADPTADLLALARYATALQNAGRPLVVPSDHLLLSRWIDTKLVRHENPKSWGPEQVEGPPNTVDFGDRSTAWASATRDDQPEWLDLIYAASVTPVEVQVFETYCPGALTAIAGFRGDREVELWRGADPTPSSAQGGTSRVAIAKGFPTNRLRVYFDSPAVSGWNEIDAVGIIDDRGRTHWAVAASASSSYSGEANPQFDIDREGLIQRFNQSPALMKRLLQDPELGGALGTPQPRVRSPRKQ